MKFSELVSQHDEEKSGTGFKELFSSDIRIWPHRINDQKKVVLYRQLHVLFRSGVDLKLSFDILIEQADSGTKQKLIQIINLIIKGKTLAEAMTGFKDFSSYEIQSIHIGETSGNMASILEKLAQHFEERVTVRRELTNALSYPILILLTAFGAVWFMAVFIIPMFTDVFMRFNRELPPLTRSVLTVAQWIRTNGIWLFVFVALCVVAIHRLSKDRKVRIFLERIWLNLPLFGDLYRKAFLTQFCGSMSLLIHANIPVIQALQLTRKMMNVVHLDNALNQIQKDIFKGLEMDESFSRHALFDSQMIAYLKIGLKVNELAGYFDLLTRDYMESVKYQTKLLTTFLEPAMIVILGLIVGAILIAMYLPMFEISNVIGP